MMLSTHLSFSNLWDSVINNFVKEFVDENVFGLDESFSWLVGEVSLQNIDDCVQELEDHSAIDVYFGGGDQDEVFVRDVEEGGS